MASWRACARPNCVLEHGFVVAAMLWKGLGNFLGKVALSISAAVSHSLLRFGERMAS